MIDHLVSFPSEAAAKAHPVMARWLSDGEWNRSVTFPGISLITNPGDEVTPPSFFPGWWIVICTEGDAPDPELAAIEPCRMAANREAALRGEGFIYPGESLRADPAQIATVVRVDGLPAGSAYPFSEPRVIA